MHYTVVNYTVGAMLSLIGWQLLAEGGSLVL